MVRSFDISQACFYFVHNPYNYFLNDCIAFYSRIYINHLFENIYVASSLTFF